MTKPTTYTVQANDTLARIAAQTGTTVADIVAINHLKNPNRLDIGQVLYLDKQYANSVQVMLMDALRQPMEGFKALLKFDGKTQVHTSNASGLLPLVSTDSIHSTIEVFVQNSRNEWVKVTQAVSGLGQQWLKLISPALKFDVSLQPHDEKAAAHDKKAVNDKTNPGKGKAQGDPIGKDHPVKKKANKDTNTVVIDVDIPQDLMEYFKLYKDEPISADDWESSARFLQCEPQVLQAVARVESGGNTAFWKLNKDGAMHVPKILFERHFFHRLTCANGPHVNTKHHAYHGKGVSGCHSPYDTDPDICWPVGFRKAKLKGEADAKMADGTVEKTDVYSDSASSYLRLLKAYRLNREAALKSASWGKFQVMGENHAACGQADLKKFIQIMCSGEKGQIQLLAGFIYRNPALHKAVQEKDWANIARIYNGPDYKTNAYDTKMEQAYHDIKKKGAA